MLDRVCNGLAVSNLESARQATILGGAPPVNCPVVLVAEIEVLPELIAHGYTALNSEQAVPPVDAEGVGTAALSLDEAGNLHFSITLTELTSSIAGAHFHGPTPAGVGPWNSDAFSGAHVAGVWEGLNARQLHYALRWFGLPQHSYQTQSARRDSWTGSYGRKWICGYQW